MAKPVALKLIALDPYSAAGTKQFLDEARVSTFLSHSNIVQVFDVGRAGDLGYLVMEVVDGVDLSYMQTMLSRSGQKLPMHVAAYVVSHILRALDYAHSLRLHGSPMGIVHRDVSPQNVILSVSGEVKLLDFGIASSCLDPTTGRQIKGKLRYMAPEQFAGGRLDARADLYSVGAVLYELISPNALRAGTSAPELYRELMAPKIPPLPRGTPAEIQALCSLLLHPEPLRRCVSAAAALSLLQSWPGFRDGSAELADLCRRMTGVRGPRAELGVAPDPVTSRSARTFTATATLDCTATGLGSAAAGHHELARTAETPLTRTFGAHPRRRVPLSAIVATVVCVAMALVVVSMAAAQVFDRRARHGNLDAPRGLTWSSGAFCEVEIGGKPAIIGYATRGGPPSRTIMDPATGSILRRFTPEETERGLVCISPTRFLVLRARPEEPKSAVTKLDVVDAEGTVIASHEYFGDPNRGFLRYGPCLDAGGELRVDIATGERADVCHTADIELLKTLRSDTCDSGGAWRGQPLGDGTWLVADRGDAGVFTVARVRPRKPRPDLFDPLEDATVVWRRLFEFERASLPRIVANPEVAALVAVPKEAGQAVVFWMDPATGDLTGQAVLPGEGRQDAGASATLVAGDRFIVGRCGSPGLLALDPSTRTVAWQHGGEGPGTPRPTSRQP